jgi:hypothetical protein
MTATAMNRRAAITVPELGDVTVDLWGREFTATPATRTVVKQVTVLQERVYQLDDEQADAIVDLLAQVIDLRLKPKGQARKKASEIIKEKWEADALTLHQLFAFMERLGEADRPT